MVFNDSQPIFKQIVDMCRERISSGLWEAGRRVPSVRELGVELTVNAHTVLKAYDILQAEGIIRQQRGLGYFLADDARERVRQARRDEFLGDTLPRVFDTMASLGLTLDDLKEAYAGYTTKQ